MQRRFSKGIISLECKKRLLNTTAFASTFHRVNLSLAGCSSAEPASVLVRYKIQFRKLYLQLVKKASHVHILSRPINRIRTDYKERNKEKT